MRGFLRFAFLAEPLTPGVIERYRGILALRDGATTPGERAAAEAAAARYVARWPDLARRTPPPRPAPPPPRPPPPPHSASPRQERRYASYESVYAEFHGETAKGGASRKFWRYDQLPEAPRSARVAWGRIGTAGQAQIVSLEAARARLREKVAKGYRVVTDPR